MGGVVVALGDTPGDKDGTAPTAVRVCVGTKDGVVVEVAVSEGVAVVDGDLRE